MVTATCPWCHAVCTGKFTPIYCVDCAHRADVGRDECDCRYCVRKQCTADLVTAAMAEDDAAWWKAVRHYADLFRGG